MRLGTPGASDSPGYCEADPHCTTARQKTHGTEPREVHYPWHPWFGRRVVVVEEVERCDRSVSRCRLEEDESGRSLELPRWMLDRAACSQVRTADAPVVRCDVLRRLKHFLEAVRSQATASVVQNQHPFTHTRGDADVPTQNDPTPAPTRPVPRASHDARVAPTPGRGAQPRAASSGSAPPLSPPRAPRRGSRPGGAP